MQPAYPNPPYHPMALQHPPAPPAKTQAGPAGGPPVSKPFRTMLARGAACDLCRSRKVKCDGVQPVCSQCKKSSRGHTVINCVYDGGALARSGGAKKNRPADKDGQGTPVARQKKVVHAEGESLKRERDTKSEDEEELRVRGSQARVGGGSGEGSPMEHMDGVGSMDRAVPPPKKRQSGPPSGQRVETLVERISELERRLHLQSQSMSLPAALHGHIRTSPSPPFYPSSAPMDATHSSQHGRRTLSFGSEGLSPKDIASTWTPESNMRRQLVDESHLSDKVGSDRYSPAYASFVPPHLNGYGDGEHHRNPDYNFSALQLPPIQMPGQGPSRGQGPMPTTFANGSSYPPLNYSTGAAASGAPNYNKSNYLASTSQGAVNFPYSGQLPLQQQQGQKSSPPNDFQRGNGLKHLQTTELYSSEPIFAPTSPLDVNSYGTSPDSPVSFDASLLQILYPAWPSSLPLPTTVDHLVGVFFSRAQVPASMISKPRLLAALDLPPDSAGFPHASLLHAICGYASVFVSAETLGGVAGEGGSTKYWEKEKTPREYHYKMARIEIDKGVIAGGNLFQMLQATILSCYMAYQAAQFTELWLLSGLATRMCTPLGLNHLAPWDFVTGASGPTQADWQRKIRNTPSVITHSLLPKATSLEEHNERAATWWAAFSIDRHASASTDWSTSIDELDISTQLPSTAAGSYAALCIRSPTFLQESSLPTGSLGLYIKAVVLLGRVINYLQRLPRYQSMPEGETCHSIRDKIKTTPEFVELDAQLSHFRSTTSANFFKAGELVDGHLASAYAIPHVASILLHELFCDREDRGPLSSIARCLTSAKCVVNSTYVLWQSSNDLSGIDPFLPFCWSVVGRALVRDHAVKRLWGDLEASNFSKQLAEHCLHFTAGSNKSLGVTIGGKLTDMLSKLLADPDQCLPPSESDNIDCFELRQPNCS